jgi:hypothetical protein
MLATLSIAFTQMAENSTVLAPATQEQIAQELEDDAEVMSNTQLEEQLAGQPREIQEEISASTPTHEISLCRSRCSCRSSPASSGSSTASA